MRIQINSNVEFQFQHQNEQVRVCLECTKFLKAYEQFKEKCVKVQSMFEIISYASPDDSNDRKFLHKVRADISLDSNDDKVCSHIHFKYFNTLIIENMDVVLDSNACQRRRTARIKFCTG